MSKPNKAADALEKETLLLERFLIIRRLGAGGFGQVYRARDIIQRQPVAVKVDTGKGGDPRRTIIEQKVLSAFRGKSHIPLIYASGKTPQGWSFIVMQLLGKNLETLRSERPHTHYRFSLSTTIRASQQVFVGLETLHRGGFIHRDMKPANVCTGYSDLRAIFLVDFGLARSIGGRRARARAHFRGTHRYASIRMHEKKECGAADDIISWMYSMLEIHSFELPWSRTMEPLKVLEKKRQFTTQKLFSRMPPGCAVAFDYVSSLEWNQLPDYPRLHELMRSCLTSPVEYTRQFDWETAADSDAYSEADVPELNITRSPNAFPNV